MVSWTIRTARSLSSAGCRCPDPCFGVCCFDAAMGYILPKNAASIKPRAVQSDTGGHGTDTVRDREAPGSNPGPPTIFVFEIDDFQCGLESPADRRITISCRATKPGRCNGVCRGQCEITRLGIVG